MKIKYNKYDGSGKLKEVAKINMDFSKLDPNDFDDTFVRRQQETVDTVGKDILFNKYLAKSKTDARYKVFDNGNSVSFLPGLRLRKDGIIERFND